MNSDRKPDSLGVPDEPVVSPAEPPRVDFASIWRRLGPVGPLAIVAASFPAIGGFVLLGSLKWVGPWLRSHGELGILIYVAGFAASAGLAILPTYAQSVLGGWTFGKVLGTSAALAGYLGGAAIGYVIARRASRDRATTLIREHRKWQAAYDALVGSGFGKSLFIVTLLRLPPNSPFAITNLVLAAARVPASVYLLGTLFGMAPRTAAAVVVGAQLSDLNLSNRAPTWMIVTGIILALIVLGIIGQIANRAIARVTERNAECKMQNDE